MSPVVWHQGKTQHVASIALPDRGVRRYIDWQPFFNVGIKGSFPDILNNPASGQAAAKYDDAQAMLDRVVSDWLTASAVVGSLRPTPSVTTSRSTWTSTGRRGRRPAPGTRKASTARDLYQPRLRRPEDHRSA